MQSDGHAALEVTAENVTVKRRIAGEKEKPSPALRPNSTLQWVPATPGSLLPMDFRGIRHWKEMRNQTSSSGGLGIIRPLGPGDAPPFSSAWTLDLSRVLATLNP